MVHLLLKKNTMKRSETKIFIVLSIFYFLFFLSCNHESTTNKHIKGLDTLSLAIAVGDSFKYTGFDATKWMSLSDDLSEENSFGFAGTKGRGEKLEKRITKGLENIDPAEYYLSDYQHVKFTDKKEMNNVRKKLERLNRIYRSNYYQNGHVLERRNNMLILSSLNQKYGWAAGEKLSKMPEEYAHNANVTQLKSGNKNLPITASDDLKSLLNIAVQLLNISQLSEPEEKQTLLSEADESLNLLKNDKRSEGDYLLCYNKAFIRYNYSDFSEAIMYGKKSVDIRKDFYLGYLLTGDSYLSSGDIEKAYEYYTAAEKIKKNIVTLERVAYTALFLGKGVIAEDCYSQILNKQDYHKNDRQNYKVGYALALAYNGKLKLAMETVKDLRVWRPTWAVTWLIEGWIDLMSGNYDLAEKAFNKSISKGDELFSKTGIALAKFCKKDYPSSTKIFYDLENMPGYRMIARCPSLLLYSGYSYVNTHDYQSALIKFINYAELEKKNDYYYLGMSLCHLGFGDYPNAKEYLDSAGTQTSNLSDYYCLKGVSALRNYEYKDARNYFERTLLIDKNNLRGINGLGSSLSALQNFEKSISVFDDGLKLKPDDAYLLFNKADAIFSIGRKLFESGSVQFAKDTIKYGCELINRALSIEPNWSISSYINIGNAYSGIKDSANALSYYGKVSCLQTEVNIGNLYANFNMIDKAKQIWQQVLEKDSSLALAAFNIKAIDMRMDGTKRKKYTNKDRFQYYCIYHDDLLYYINYKFPVLFEKYFEPLPPLGYANLKFAKITNEKDQ